jgi:NitT/TauT family transport system ATP-binding protein
MIVRGAQLGYVFQDATLLPWRTVLGNVELPAELRKVPKAERRALAEQAIQLVGLTGFEHHHPRRLSGGMRMRVSLARALTLDPSVFLFDEPFGALDQITRERLNDELLQLFMRNRFAGLFVTHSVYEAAFLASRVLVMSPRPGRVTGEVEVPFDYPRFASLRFEPSFAKITGRISGLLRESHQ